MALWYDKKGKAYAADERTWWIRFYVEQLVNKLRKDTETDKAKHYAGQQGRHRAEDVDFSSSATVKEAIESEASQRSTRDEALSDMILEEIASRRTEYLAESSERRSMDEALKAKIAEEVKARQDKDDELSKGLSDERTARQSKDTGLELKITDEIAGRTAEDNRLQGEIDGVNSELLGKSNTAEYTPSEDYNPATKKYADDLVNEEAELRMQGYNILRSSIEKSDWNAKGLLEYRGVINCTDINLGSDGAEAAVEARLDALEDTSASGKKIKYFYYIRLKGSSYEKIALLIDDGYCDTDYDMFPLNPEDYQGWEVYYKNRCQRMYLDDGRVYERQQMEKRTLTGAGTGEQILFVSFWSDWCIVRGAKGEPGEGDMLKSTYDRNGSGTVDDAERLGGHAPGYYAKASEALSVTLAADNWSGTAAPYTQLINVPGLGASQNGNISVAQTATAEQRAAARGAVLSVTAQTNGSLTVTADGVKPAADIPVTVVLM